MYADDEAVVELGCSVVSATATDCVLDSGGTCSPTAAGYNEAVAVMLVSSVARGKNDAMVSCSEIGATALGNDPEGAATEYDVVSVDEEADETIEIGVGAVSNATACDSDKLSATLSIFGLKNAMTFKSSDDEPTVTAPLMLVVFGSNR